MTNCPNGRPRSMIAAVLMPLLSVLGLAFPERAGAESTPSFVARTHAFRLGTPFGQKMPAFADIDDDGDLDAFVGENMGIVLFLENTGTASAPAFADPSVNPFGLAGLTAIRRPALADIDGDGDLDAFIDTGNTGLQFVENTGTANAPAFAPASTGLFGLPSGGLSDVPEFADIDGDGDLDAFAAQSSFNFGTVFFENTGTPTAPAFAPSSVNPFGLTTVGIQRVPVVFDMDADGDLDLLVRGSAVIDGDETYFFENTGTPNAPAFAAPVASPFGLPGPDLVGRFAAADIDDDGDPDLFAEASFGSVVLFANVGAPNAPTSRFRSPSPSASRTSRS